MKQKINLDLRKDSSLDLLESLESLESLKGVELLQEDLSLESPESLGYFEDVEIQEEEEEEKEVAENEELKSPEVEKPRRTVPIEFTESCIKLPIEKFAEIEKLFVEGNFYLIAEEIRNAFEVLRGINNKGFINSLDLLNYPFINECIQKFLFIRDEEVEKDKKKKKRHVSYYEEGKTAKVGDVSVTLKEGKEFFK
jgi:hypothetical protein